MSWAEALPFPRALQLHCDQLQRARSFCEDVQRELGPRDIPSDERLRLLRSWAQDTRVRRAASRLVMRVPTDLSTMRKAKKQLDRGIGLLFSGRFGEGLDGLLLVWRQYPALQVASDAAYVGFHMIAPQLDAGQRRDWAKNLASRIGDGLETQGETLVMRGVEPAVSPSADTLIRLSELYHLAEDWRASTFYLVHMQKLYPNDRRVGQATQVLLEVQSRLESLQKKRGRKKRRFR